MAKMTIIGLAFVALVSIYYICMPYKPQLIPQQPLQLNEQTMFIQQYLQAKTKMSFKQWKITYSKIYADSYEEMYRQIIFMRNLVRIKRHNQLFQSRDSSYFMAINQFADLTGQQFIRMFTRPLKHNNKAKEQTFKINTTQCKGSIMDAPNPPQTIDWKNKISQNVTNQGSCGDDWAIVAVAAVESLYALKMGLLPILSVQQLLQCSGDYGNQGCSGGFMDQAFWYIIDNGIATNKSYPNTQKIGFCRYVLNMKYTQFGRCARIPSGNYSKLLSAIIQQPVSIGLNMNAEMQFYGGGIYNGTCTTDINKGMLLTGYGGGGNITKYWRLKNSMGNGWGDKGYLMLEKLQINGPGRCGIQLMASVPQNLGLA